MTHCDRYRVAPRMTVALILAMLVAVLPGATVPAMAEVDPDAGALASTQVRLPAGTLTWHATDRISVAGDDVPLELSPGFVLALDDPLLLLFDGTNQIARLQANGATALATPSRATPLAMVAESPVPFMTVELLDAATMGTAQSITFEPDAETLNVDAGEYQLSLWRWDVAQGIPDATADRLSRLTIPPLVYVRSGQAEVSSASAGDAPTRLGTGEWAVVAPDATLGDVPGAPPPVLLIATLDQPGGASTSTGGNGQPGGTSGQPGGTGGQPSSGGTQMPAEEPTLVPTEIPTQVPMVVPTTEPASTGSDTSQSQSQSGTTSGCGDVIILCVEDNPVVLIPMPTEGSDAIGDLGPPVLLNCAFTVADSDNDGLLDECEPDYGTDPNNDDSDGDGLEDGDEVHTYGTDPALTDSDGDSLGDFNEVHTYRTDPLNFDTDGDGLDDGFDLGGGTDPLDSDFDDDGLIDGDEINYYLTYPKVADSDEDGLNDGDEINVYGTYPLAADTDGDCLSDGREISWGWSPLAADTDGDGYWDPFDEKPRDPNVADQLRFPVECG